MKKTSFILISALSIVALASCTKELISPDEASDLKTTTVTLTLDPATKTSLDGGKTVWNAGDKILLTDGTSIDTLKVTAADAGTSTATVTSISFDAETIYAIYPATAYKSVTDGKVNIKVAADQSGEFKDANICVASASDYKFKMKNATAVMKVTTPEDGLYVVFNASGDALASNLAVSFEADGSIASEEASGSTGIVTMEAPTAGDYYVAVAPGTYKAGFSIMAISNADGKFQSKATKSAKTLAINDLADLGTIGDELSGFDGTGTESDPYQIKTLGEMIALANSVNIGKTYKGEYLDVMNDISGVTLPIGYYTGAKDDKYFNGNFNGNGHTITLNLDGANCKTTNYVALFGVAQGGSVIKDVKLAGTVTSTGNYVAGLIGYGRGTSTDSLIVRNCENNAAVSTTGNYAGGISGFATDASITGCTNGSNGTVSGVTYVAGIIGSLSASSTSVVKSCTNDAKIVGTGYSVAGIVGYAQQAKNKTITSCINNGSIEGLSCVGGIVGYAYYTSQKSCINNGSIVATQANATGMYGLSSGKFTFTSGYNAGNGGISGWNQNSSLSDCINTGSVTGPNKVGGIAGATYWSSVTGCNNSGDVTGKYSYTLGIVFGSATGGIIGWHNTRYDINSCTNTGNIMGPGGLGGIVGVAQSTTSYVVKLYNCTNRGTVTSTSESAGGIIGIAWSQKAACYMDIEYCANYGSVSGTAAVGGIAGKTYDANNSQTGVIDKCSNAGNVTGNYYIGGIVGFAQSRSTTGKSTIRNVSNEGDVFCKRTDDQPAYIGGIVGHSTKLNNSYGIKLSNAYNLGSVKFAKCAIDTCKTSGTNVAGIVGYLGAGTITNVYSGGVVGPQTGSATELQTAAMGAIVGAAESTSTTINNAYYLDETCANAIGTKYASIIAEDSNVCAASADGSLLGTVLISDISYTSLVPALNAWVNGSSVYYSWDEGPVFVTE